jgi:hypothetical protein
MGALMNDRSVDTIRQALATMRQQADVAGAAALPPILVLGVFERVGSNWLLATVNPETPVYNEPLRQQIHPSHPLSPLHVPVSTGVTVQPGDASLARHWLAAFVLAKYGQPASVMKETNLFFAIRPMLELFPDAPVVVLSRAALGIVSSFQRSDLFGKWGYRSRYEALRQLTKSARWQRWQFALPDTPDETEQLTRLIFLNAALLVDATAGRARDIVGYEGAVLHPAEARQELPAYLPLAAGPADVEQTSAASSVYEASDQAVRSAGHVTVRADPRTPLPHRAFVPDDGHDGLRWRNLLVSNAEFAAFLNDLRVAGIANVRAGVQFCFNEIMPASRGGKIHFDVDTGTYVVSPGFETHPVYWVTWLGAALMARRAGARLPTRHEALRLMLAQPAAASANLDFRLGDTASVAEPGHGAACIHHRVGNVQVWCADGPAPTDTGTVVAQRYFVGAAWNTVGDAADVSRLKHRWVFGSSRGIGT